MRDDRLLAACLALLVPLYGLCTEPNPEPAPNPPTPEVLEFLGQWETSDGEFIDPLALDAMPESEPVNKHHGQAID